VQTACQCIACADNKKAGRSPLLAEETVSG